MIKIETGSTNVYADLGMDNASQMLTKAKLVDKINQSIKQKGLTQKQASEIIGISQPKLSSILNGNFRGVSETKMLEIIASLGHSVNIIISDTSLTNAQPIKVNFSGYSDKLDTMLAQITSDNLPDLSKFDL